MAHIRRASVLVLCISLLALGLVAGCDSDDKRPAAPNADTVPPAIPDGLAASYDDGAVLLAWDANVTDPDLAGYMVYRSLRENVGYTALVTAPVTTNAWQDDAIQKGNTYYYRVAAIDAAGNESGLSFTFQLVVPNDGSNLHRQLGSN